MTISLIYYIKDNIGPAVGVLLLAWYCLAWIQHSISLAYGKWRLHTVPDVNTEDLKGISIIKPLTGVDPNLYQNLESFFAMKYPAYELLFCIEDDKDQALPIVRALIKKYSHVEATLLTGANKVGCNGKINNMIKGYDKAKYDYVMISDSSMKVQEDTLLDMAASMRSNVGIVQQVPYVGHGSGFAHIYEKVYFGTQIARSHLSANFFGLNCPTGSSCVIRKHVLDEFGGLSAFGKYLAEDFFISVAIRNRGYRTVICGQPAIQNTGKYCISDLHSRMIRWSHLRSRMIPIFILLEPISECMLLGVLVSWTAQCLLHLYCVYVFLIHLVAWFTFDYLLIRTIESGPLPFSHLQFVAAWLLRELSSPFLTIKAYLTTVIVWRHRRYRVKCGGITESV